MKHCTINLSHSGFYEQFQYPGGESQVRLRPEYIADISDHARIISRQPDVMKLALLVSAIRGLHPTGVVEVVLPYLPYGRADRRFVGGDCFGLEAFATIINAIKPDRVLTLDAHSSKASLLINDLVDVPALDLIYKAICRFAERHRTRKVIALFPDKGARERYVLNERYGSNHGGVEIETLHCDKVRDAATGKLLGFTVPSVDRPALIVDDICDGGGTFLGIAGELRGGAPLGLYVTHGIFSQGFEKLHGAFDIIYTTDSFRDVSTLDAGVFDSMAAIGEYLKKSEAAQ